MKDGSKEHNLSINHGYDIIKNGKVVQSWWDDAGRPQIDGEIKIQDASADGIIESTHKQKMESFIQYFLSQGSPVVTNTDIPVLTGGLAPTNNSASNGFVGICVGNSSTPVLITQTGLLSQIYNSITALYYEATTVGLPYYDNGYLKIDISRTFHNRAASAVSIYEYCLFMGSYPITRDVISTGYSLAAGKKRIVTVTLMFPVSAQKGFTSFFINKLWQSISGGARTYKGTDGNDYVHNTNTTSMLTQISIVASRSGAVAAYAGYDGYGLQVGSGNAAFNWETDYKLETQILHGNTENKLYYSASCYPPDYGVIPYQSGTSWIAEGSRQFTNNTASPIVVREASLVANGKWQDVFASVYTNVNLMFYRWLTGDITIQPGETLVVRVRYKITA